MVRCAVEFIQITWNCTRVRTLASYMSPLSLVLRALIFPEIVLLYTPPPPPPYYLEICITDKTKLVGNVQNLIRNSNLKSVLQK